MPTIYKTDNPGATAAEIEARLPKTYFVRRGDIVSAFGLSREDFAALVPSVFKPAPLPAPKAGKKQYDRFVRAQVLEAARAMEHGRKPA
jgi:hypothetical protein